MIIDIVMPKMGESITEGTILEWKKEIGEFVEMDEILLEIGTDKVDSETGRVESDSSKGAEGSVRAVKEKNDW